jgi:hypothetical protein
MVVLGFKSSTRQSTFSTFKKLGRCMSIVRTCSSRGCKSSRNEEGHPKSGRIKSTSLPNCSENIISMRLF